MSEAASVVEADDEEGDVVVFAFSAAEDDEVVAV